jgi:hypothetical protein
VQQAFAVFGNMRDADGEPITIESAELVVPPSLEVVAMNIINATEIWVTTGSGDLAGGTAAQQVHVANWVRNKLRISVNPYIPVVASSANGSTSWFIFASPQSGRPALEVGFLRGYEQPGLYRKASNTMRVGGGIEDSLGDFDSGEVQYKGMHIIGGTRLSPIMAVASNGSGS